MRMLALGFAIVLAGALAVAPAEARKGGGGGHGISRGATAYSGGGRAFRGSVRSFAGRGLSGPRVTGRHAGRHAFRGVKGGPVHRHRGRHIRRYSGYGFGPAWYYGGVYEGAYGYGYGGCEWIYRRAMATNSLYWWNRFEACMDY